MKKRLALFCVTALALFAAVAQAGEKITDISHDDLKKAIADGSVTVIDVNGTASYKAGHIPGAIDYSAKKDDLAAVLPKDKNALIVAYCGSPACGAYKKAADAAVALGYTNVKHYSGGLSGWKAKNETLEPGA